MNKITKGILSIVLAGLLAVGLLPAATMAVGIQANTFAFTLNESTVSFAGYEWYVVGDSASSVAAPSGHITLLAKQSFGNKAFRKGQSGDPGDGSMQPFLDYGFWYVGSFITPNDYDDSTLMHSMASIAGGLPGNEAAQITPRALDEIGGIPVSDQKLWPLSESEYIALGSISGDTFTDDFWLRTPTAGAHYHARVGYSCGMGDTIYRNDYVFSPMWGHMRPALYLDLASVLFASDASGEGAKPSAAGSTLFAAAATANNIKFTFFDGSAAPNIAYSGSSHHTNTLNFSFSGARTGANQYLSCVLVDGGGNVAYYGKLAECATNSSGTFGINTSGLAAGTYTLKIFCEQANDALHSDFAGSPATFTLTVDSRGRGKIPGGTVPSDPEPVPDPTPVPLAPPQTGDKVELGLWVVPMLVLSLAVFAAAYLFGAGAHLSLGGKKNGNTY